MLILPRWGSLPVIGLCQAEGRMKRDTVWSKPVMASSTSPPLDFSG